MQQSSRAMGDRIGMDHLMASAGYLPEFAPVEIAGRLLGDGGLSANAPAEAELALPLDRPGIEANAARAGLRAEWNRTRAILYLSYRAPREEAGPEKPFDLSPATVNDRWRAGDLDMAEALRRLAAKPLPARGCALMSIRRQHGVSASASERTPENAVFGE